ncbi:MAG: ATP-binding cassette domain-containing protein [Chloroflexi bacterium]|nr:ATP-binding cassette domain-containing protein [Chloroflexota bacterium]MCL5074775.1 ATP-binding cassette domain-containing protein [Chloroflexota bacterium]
MQIQPLVRMKDIYKSFGAVQALRGASCEVLPGEVLGIVGDNAAGKSTMMKVLTGVYQPDEGHIYFEGKPLHFREPMDSRRHGIEMIYQDFALAENLDVRSNIFLGREIERRYFGGLVRVLNNRKMEEESLRVLDLLDLEINPRLKVRRLSGGQRQAVAIGRAVAFDAKLVIMDEPTASLAVGKVGKLLALVRRLKELNVAVIIISHRLDEIFEIGDHVTVMKEGRDVGTFLIKEVTQSHVRRLIVEGGRIDA